MYTCILKHHALHGAGTQQFRSKYLWRGMRDRKVSRDFLVLGGTEMVYIFIVCVCVCVCVCACVCV